MNVRSLLAGWRRAFLGRWLLVTRRLCPACAGRCSRLWHASCQLILQLLVCLLTVKGRRKLLPRALRSGKALVRLPQGVCSVNKKTASSWEVSMFSLCAAGETAQKPQPRGAPSGLPRLQSASLCVPGPSPTGSSQPPGFPPPVPEGKGGCQK